MTPLRILVLAANRWWTGSADPTLSLARGLRGRGHHVELACIRGDRFEAKAREAGFTPRPELSLEPRSPFRMLTDVRVFRTILRREGFQIVHVNHSHDHWLAAFSAPGIPVTIVRTFHTLKAVRDDPLHRWLYRRRCDGAVAVSRRIERRCLEAGVPRGRCVRIAGAVDLRRFSPEVTGAAIRQELGLGAAPVAGTVSRLAPNRGHEFLLRAFRGVLQAMPDARLVIVGKGENQGRLEIVARQLGLSRAVVFAGYRDQDLPQALAAMDVFALMGAGSEESCRAALEAMAAGRPVVARQVGALPETIRHGETGWLLDGDAPDELTGVLLTLLKDPERARALGLRGRRLAEAAYGEADRAERMEGFYRGILAEPFR